MHLITTTQALEEAVSALAKSDFVTVDTEFIRETTFWPELCLIQMASPDHTALVDALAPGLDLAPFFRLMADETIVKVFHAARQDIEIVFHLGDLIPSPVFVPVYRLAPSPAFRQAARLCTGRRYLSARYLSLSEGRT